MHCTCTPKTPSRTTVIGSSVFAICEACHVYWHSRASTADERQSDVDRLGSDEATAEWARRAADMLREYQPDEPPMTDDEHAADVDAIEIPF